MWLLNFFFYISTVFYIRFSSFISSEHSLTIKIFTICSSFTVGRKDLSAGPNMFCVSLLNEISIVYREIRDLFM